MVVNSIIYLSYVFMTGFYECLVHIKQFSALQITEKYAKVYKTGIILAHICKVMYTLLHN